MAIAAMSSAGLPPGAARRLE